MNRSATSPRGSRRLLGGLVALAGAVILLGASTIGASAAPALPRSMAATGDSITRAYNTGWFPYVDNPAASWSTGTNSTVRSHYSRILALNPVISGRNWNDAKSGAKMVDLNGQMTTVAGRHVDYVTVLMGGNDVCTSSESTMTSVTNFRAQFTTAMNTITTSSPTTLVYVVSIPNVYQLWSVLKNNGTARAVWWTFGVCQSMLANPLSTAGADVARRARVLQRDRDFNTALEEICAVYVQCRFDNNAVFNTAFVASDITSRDYFHPSVSGQAKLAAVSWAAGYWGP